MSPKNVTSRVSIAIAGTLQEHTRSLYDAMLRPSSYAFVWKGFGIDFASLKNACPKGLYVTPVPDEPLLWTGVLFVRKGPYAKAVLRFQIAFTEDFPVRHPVVTFLTDVFHPLVAPLTTYTHSTRDSGDDTVSAADEEKLPPGGLSLRHGFPEWFEKESDILRSSAANSGSGNTSAGRKQASEIEPHLPSSQSQPATDPQPDQTNWPHIVEVLQYLRIIFDTETVIDTIPLEVAANSGAWHAWRRYRAKVLDAKTRPSSQPSGRNEDTESSSQRSMSPRQQPGGARRPGEWNWTGVWEDRVRKAVQASIADSTIFGGDGSEVIGFTKMDEQAVQTSGPSGQARNMAAT